MPKSSGLFTEEERGKITEWLELKAKSGFACHTCGGKSFSFYSHLVAAPVASADGAAFDNAFEVVGAVCSNCGHVCWYDADTLGVGSAAPFWTPSDDERAADQLIAQVAK